MSSSPIGRPVTRIDGKLKVSGGAPYAVEYAIPNVAYGVAVTSSIGNGRITRVDSSAAEKMPGVLAVLHHGNIGTLYRPAGSLEQMSRPGESRPPFEDENIYYYGQYVALMIANTLEQAQDAAHHVRVEYDTSKPIVSMTELPALAGTLVAESHRGDFDSAFQKAPVQIDETYVNPVETHNPMELHGTIAVWDGDKLTLYESSQGVVNHHNVASQVLDMPLEDIDVISRFVGSGFGDKLFPWPHSWMAAMGAKHVARPVKLVLSRRMMFSDVGHRPVCRQRMRLGATPDGKLVALRNDILQHTSMVDEYVENCVEGTAMLYSCPNLTAEQHVVGINVGTPTPMRGPGRTPALFAVESAMDEMAIKLNMDPLEFRLKNYAEQDEASGLPWSSKHLRECYQMGAERFGWSKRNPKVGSMRNGNLILGWGVASCTWPATQHNAAVRVRLMADGTARASCATQDIGTGTYTVFAEVVASKTGLPVDKVQVLLGDSSLPPGPTSGGSSATSTVLPAIAKATDNALDAIFKAASETASSPVHGVDPKTLKMTGGRIHTGDKSPNSGVPFQDILMMRRMASLDGMARTEAPPEQKKYALHSFGAHFCEVSYDPEIARVHVTRWLSVIDGGRMINEKTARNQILGAVVMGVGMGLLEETIYDPRNGNPINSNYADYMVPVNADIPELDCILLDYPDPQLSPYGARGIGEIGLTGCASAIAMATFHATGVRVRELPILVEKIMPKVA